jgi:hypothetical protein
MLGFEAVKAAGSGQLPETIVKLKGIQQGPDARRPLKVKDLANKGRR